MQLRQGGTHPLDDRENFLRLHGPCDALVDGNGCRHGGVLGGAQVGGGAGRAEIPGQPRRVHEGSAAMGKLQVLLLLLLLEVLQVGGRQGAIGPGRRRAVGAAAAGMEGGHIGGGGPCRRSCCPNPGVVSPAAEGCGGLGRARWRVDPCIARAAAAGAALSLSIRLRFLQLVSPGSQQSRGDCAAARRGGPEVAAPAAAAVGGTHSTFDSQSPFNQEAGLLPPAGAGGAASLPPSLPPAGSRVRPARAPEGGESPQHLGACVSAPGSNFTSLAWRG